MFICTEKSQVGPLFYYVFHKIHKIGKSVIQKIINKIKEPGENKCQRENKTSKLRFHCS